MEEFAQQSSLPPEGSIEAKDPLAAPIPGSSLTMDNSRWAWGNPPQLVDPEIVLDKAMDFLEQPKNKEEIIKLLLAGVSIESLVEGYMIQGFQEGKFSIDVGLLIKTPLALYIAEIAEEETIPYRLFESEDELEKGTMKEEDFFQLMKANNPAMFGFMRETINKAVRDGQNQSDIIDEDVE